MTALSDLFSKSTKQILALFGETLTFTRTTHGAYDTATGETTSPSDANYTALAVPQEYDRFDREDENIEESDVKLIMGQTSTGTVPAINDTVILEGKTHTIKDVRQVSINGIKVAFESRIRI